MKSQQYLDEMKEIQLNILEFLDNDKKEEEAFQNLERIFNDVKISEDKNKIMSILHLICEISNNHHHSPNFYSKIEKILIIFKDNIKIFFSNWEIFSIFATNKRILLFFIEEQIIKMDKNIVAEIKTDKYQKFKYVEYFAPEIKHFPDNFNSNKTESIFKNSWDYKSHSSQKIIKKIPENFNELRRVGENESEVCKLIREDLVKEFIIYISKNNIPLELSIKESIYETNSFLLDQNEITMIEYAAFFGSIQIFNYLQINEAKLTTSIWFYAIHSQNAELIKTLEDLLPIEENTNDDQFYKKMMKESIKCHHNDIANYFIENYLDSDEETLKDVFKQSLMNYNFQFIQNEFINESSFLNLCKYDYYILVANLLKNQNIDINQKKI